MLDIRKLPLLVESDSISRSRDPSSIRMAVQSQQAQAATQNGGSDKPDTRKGAIAHAKNAHRMYHRRRHSLSAPCSLPAEAAALGEAGLAAGGLAQHLRAAGAHHHGLRVAEHRRDREAARALDVHEEGARARHQRLELVLARFRRRRRVQEVDCEDLWEFCVSAALLGPSGGCVVRF